MGINDSPLHRNWISGSNIHGLFVDSKGELEMSAYELGIKTYNENGLLMENPFQWGSSNYDLWEDGWWDSWFETNFPSK